MARSSALKKALVRMREAVAEWASDTDPNAFREGLELWLEDTERDGDDVLQALCFALVYRPAPDVPSLVERYKAAGFRHSSVERIALGGWEAGSFRVLEVLEAISGRSVRVRDILTDEILRIDESSLSQLDVTGKWLFGFLSRFQRSWQFDAALRFLEPWEHIDVVQAILEGTETPSVAGLRGIRLANRPKRLQNSDGHLLVPVTVVFDVPFERVVERLRDHPDAELEDDDLLLLIQAEASDLVGSPAVYCAFEADGDRTVLKANSRERADTGIALLGLPVLERHEEPVPNDPEGRATVVENMILVTDTEEPEEAMQDRAARQFPSSKIPALGGLTPVQALEAGRIAEVRALAPAGLPDAFWTERGLRP